MRAPCLKAQSIPVTMLWVVACAPSPSLRGPKARTARMRAFGATPVSRRARLSLQQSPCRARLAPTRPPRHGDQRILVRVCASDVRPRIRPNDVDALGYRAREFEMGGIDRRVDHPDEGLATVRNCVRFVKMYIRIRIPLERGTAVFVLLQAVKIIGLRRDDPGSFSKSGDDHGNGTPVENLVTVDRRVDQLQSLRRGEPELPRRACRRSPAASPRREIRPRPRPERSDPPSSLKWFRARVREAAPSPRSSVVAASGAKCASAPAWRPPVAAERPAAAGRRPPPAPAAARKAARWHRGAAE